MNARQNILFVDSAVNDYQTLLDGLDANTEIVLISGGDALRQMADAVSGRHDLGSIQILSHGSDGRLQLGGTPLDSKNLSQFGDELARLGASLAPDGDLLLYGCDIGAGEMGQGFVEQLALATGADVAASNDPTGNTAQGGDWDLEIQSGNIDANLPFSAKALADFGHLLANVTYDFESILGYSGNVLQTINGKTIVVDGQDIPLYNHTVAGNKYIYAGSGESKVTFSLNGESFTAGSLQVRPYTGATPSYTFSSDNGHTSTTTLTAGVFNTVTLNWAGVTKIYVNAFSNAPRFDNFIVDIVTNTAPVLGGTFTTAGTVNDNATTTPFSGVTYTDADGTSYTVNITYSAANGTLSGTGLSGNAGNYTVTGTSAADVQTKLQALVFTPTANQVAPASTVQTTFTLTPNDGTVSGTANGTTLVTATSVNNTPTDIALSNATVTTYDTTNATVGTLSTTDVDTGDSFTYSLVSGSGDTNNASFNISGGSLRANDPSQLTPGTYNVRVRTTDAGSAIYEEALTITVSDVLTVTTSSDSGDDATTGGSYGAELADGGGLSLREALALASAGGKTIGFAASVEGHTISLQNPVTVPDGTVLDADTANTLTIQYGTDITRPLTASGSFTINNGTGDLLTLGPWNGLNGTGTLTKTGAGTLAFPSSGSLAGYSGTLAIDGGTVKLAQTENLWPLALTIASGASLNLFGKNQTFTSVSGSGTVTNSTTTWATLTANIADGQQSTFSGNFSGNNTSLTKSGLGTLQIDGTATTDIGGDIRINDGVLELNKTSGTFSSLRYMLGSNGQTADSDILRWLGNDQVKTGEQYWIYSSGLLDLNGYNQTVSGVNAFKLYGGGEIRTGAGTLTLSGATITQNGSETVDFNGQLSLTAINTFTTGTGLIDVSANISGNGILAVAGTGTLKLSGTASYSNETRVNAGTLSIAGDNNIGSGDLLLGGGTLLVTGSDVTIDNAIALTNNSTINNANTLTLSGVLSDSSNLAKSGAGTLILSNTNTNTGTISVNAGVVQLDGKVGGGITVAGGTLAGGGASTAAGEATGSVTVQSGGTLSPGASGGSGVADLKTGNLTVASGGTLTMTLNGTTTAGTDYDQVITTGTVNVTGATLSVSGSVTPAVGDVFVLVDNDSNDAVTGTFNGLAEGATVTVNGTAMKISYAGGTGNDITLTAQMGFSALALSADTGSSSSDFVTSTAAQTITATLSSALGSTGITIWGSLDNGSNWTDVTSMISGTTLTWTGVTLAGSNTLKLEARNASSVVVGSTSQTYTFDDTAPTTTIATLAFSADTGSSSTDFITKTAAQTISGTLSGVTVTGEKVQVSLDNGAHWVDATNTVGQNTWSLAGQTLTSSNTLKVRVIDLAGNTGTEASQAYVLDQTGPTLTFSALALSADTGSSSTDFKTATAGQTLTATLSGTLAGTDKVYGSLDDGNNWTDITNKVSGTTLTWDGVTLVGSNTLKLKVTDEAGNDGTVASQAFVLDTAAPTASVTTANVGIGSNVTTSQSTEPGVIYLVPSTETPTTYASLEALVTSGMATKATVTTGGSNTPISTTGLTAGTYKIYSVDAAGNISGQSTNTITLGTAPTTTVATAAFSDDSGISSTDFITRTAAQTISGTLSAITVTGETVEVSLDNGSHWTTASNTIGQSTWSLAGQTLSGSDTLLVRVTSGGFAGTAYSHSYSIDSTAPTTTIATKSFSADTGTSSTDFITKTAAQTISGTLSANLAADEVVQVSLDDGSTWTTATTTGLNTWNLSGQMLPSNGTLKIQVTDLAGNTGTVASQAYVLDTTAPTITFSALALSADTGASSTDFNTATAHQTITATLSGAPAGTDKVFGSLNNGSSWTDITNKVSGTTLTWDNVTLVGSNTLKLKVSDEAGNDGTVASQAFVLSTVAPVFQSAATSSNGSKIILTYNAPLSAPAAVAGDFTVTVGGQVVTVTAVSINGSTLELNLQGAISNGQAVTVAYTDPSGGDDNNAIQDDAGNDALTLASTSVTNTVPSNNSSGTQQTVDGVTLTSQTGNTQTTVTNPTTGQTTTVSTQTTTTTVPIVTTGRTEQNNATPNADIPLAQDSSGAPLIQASIPVGIGLTSEAVTGSSGTTLGLRDLLIAASQPRSNTDSFSSILDQIDTYVPGVNDQQQVAVRTITFSSNLTTAPGEPITITGASGTGEQDAAHPDRQEALVIDVRNLPSGTVLNLDNVEFAIIIGATRVVGGNGQNYVIGDNNQQYIVLGAEDDVLHGGGGDDTIGSKGGDDKLFGDEGNDTLFGGTGHNILHGGLGQDVATYEGNKADYIITQTNGITTVTPVNDPTTVDTLINIESVVFADQTVAVQHAADIALIATFYHQVLGRQAEVGGYQYWASVINSGSAIGSIAMGFIHSAEFSNKANIQFDTLSLADQVESLYVHLLGRASEAEGKAHWLHLANSGVSMEEIANGFAHSAELVGKQLSTDQWDFML